MHSTASSETAGAAMVMTGMGTGVAGISMITPTAGTGMEVAGTTMVTIMGAPPMIGMGTARGRITGIHMRMEDRPLAVVSILVLTLAVILIRVRTRLALAPF